MKILNRLIFLFIFCLLPYEMVTAQTNENKTIETSINHPSNRWKENGNIEVNIKFGTAPYSVYLSNTSIPASESDILIYQENIEENTFTFNNLKRGDYYVFVKDSKNIVEFTKVNLDNSNKL